jgi:hypothetical protein
MTGKQTRQGGLIWHGWAPDTDPIYQNAGWNFISGSNLNRTKEQRPTSEPAKKPKVKAKKAVKKA